MLDQITKHMDYIVVIIAAVLIYRLLGEPLAFKV
jgi:hypothetical protein